MCVTRRAAATTSSVATTASVVRTQYVTGGHTGDGSDRAGGPGGLDESGSGVGCGPGPAPPSSVESVLVIGQPAPQSRAA